MSHYTLASGSSSQGGGGAGYDVQGSPVPYRIGPLAYEPVSCDLEMQAEQRGRMYDRCMRARIAGLDCPFDSCADEECSAVWHLKEELNAKQQQLQAKDNAVQALEAKLKDENQCAIALGLLCVFLLFILVVVLLNSKKA